MANEPVLMENEAASWALESDAQAYEVASWAHESDAQAYEVASK